MRSERFNPTRDWACSAKLTAREEAHGVGECALVQIRRSAFVDDRLRDQLRLVVRCEPP
jgi:hypothetical protein